MIVFDTETTGFVKAIGTPLNKQPHIIEFAAIKLDSKSLKEIDRIDFLVKPPIKLPEKIIEITGITDADLIDAKPFSAHYGSLVKFFLGEASMTAHNCAFDRDMLNLELRRLGRTMQFPWPTRHICTVEKSYNISGHRLKLSQLHEIATGETFKGAHRAMVDVEALVRCVKFMREKGLL